MSGVSAVSTCGPRMMSGADFLRPALVLLASTWWCTPVREQSVLAAAALDRKTTLLRDVARLMSSPHSKGGLGMSVVVVDTSNEIAGGLVVRA